jgi:SAM-dependent methyltransferase
LEEKNKINSKKDDALKVDNFLNISFKQSTLDIYYIRTSIFNVLKENLPAFKGSLLDIGCGKMPYRDYILSNSKVEAYTGLDIENALQYEAGIKPDYTWDGIIMPFENNQFDTAFGTEVMEHCPKPDIILKEVFRVLKPGAVFFFTVPFLWPLHEVPHDEFRYTPFSLKRLLEEAGFKDISIKAIGGWHAAMAQMLGLWVRRASMGSTKRKMLSFILKPVISYLVKIEKYATVEFYEGQMITGLSGIAYKPAINNS